MGKSCGPASGSGAMDAAFGHRIDLEAARRDLLAAIDAMAVLAVGEASHRHLDTREVTPARALRRLLHGLALQSIGAGQAADGLLVELDRCPRCRRKG